MKGSSVFLPGLAPPIQILPQQQAPHFSATLASQSPSCRHVRQYTIRLQGQELPGLDNGLRLKFLLVELFPSSFHGDGKALQPQIPWSKENFKNALQSYPTRGPKRSVDVKYFSRRFDESHRPRGSYPSRVVPFSAELPRTFYSAKVDLNRAWDFNAPGELDRSSPPSPPDLVKTGWKGMPVSTGSSISELRSSRRAQESTSSELALSPAIERPRRRFETAYVVCEEPLTTRIPNRVASSSFYGKENLRTTEARVESENVITEQAVLANVYRKSRSRVQQAFYEFRDPWRVQDARIASKPHKREAQSAESCRPVGATGRGNDAQSPESRSGAAKWTSAANVIKQNRNPSLKVLSRIKSLQQTTDSLNVAPTFAVDKNSNRTRSITAKDVLEIRQLEPLSREKEGQSTPISEGRVTRCGSKDSCRDTPQGNGTVCIGGSLGGAVAVLQNRLQRGVTTDSGTYVKVLQMCLKQKDLSAAKQVQDCIIKSGMDKNPYVAGTLMNVYIKCGGLLDARRVFDDLKMKTLIDWNSMIAAYAKNGNAESAFELFKLMRQEGARPNDVTFLCILKACAIPSALKWGKEVHEYIRHAGFESDVRVGNALLNMYSKCGCMTEARRVFEKLANRDVITWNIMIGAHAQSGHGMEAYGLFLQMRREGFGPDAFTYANILKASASAGALEWVEKVHGHALKAGLESDLRVGSALVHMYAKSGSLGDARLVFDRMEKRNVITWNIVIGAYAESGRGMEAYGLFLQMRREGFEPDVVTYASILNASASAGASDWVKKVHAHALKAGLESELRVGNGLVHVYAKSGSIDDARLVFDRMEKRDVITWNIMIGAYAESGRGMEAYGLFLEMRREGFEPDAVTYASILNASISAGALDWVKKVHGHARVSGLESDLRVGSALVHMYAKSGSINDARLVFDRMDKSDVVTWTVMIGGLAEHGCGHEALELFRKMIVDRVKPNGSSFVAVLSACSHGGLVDDGRRLFSAMTQDYGIEPDIVHYTCMVDLLGRAGHLEEAKQFMSDMAVEPGVVTWRSLLGACRTYGNVELGELAADEVFKLEPEDASAYVLLSNIYAAAGKWEKVSSVRTMMQERRVRKVPGRSWIEVDNKIHEFFVGDTSHPDAEAIYTELNILTEKLKAEGYIPDTRMVLHEVNEEDKELALCSHSEKLAITYGLMHLPWGEPIRVYKNLRVCSDCHSATKYISKVTGREIIARDANRFHHFKDGLCSCGDYW